MNFVTKQGPKPGLYVIVEDDDGRWIAPPITVYARTHDMNGEHYGNLVRFHDPEGREHSCILGYPELMEGKEAIQRLADLGFRPSNRRKDIDALKEYILREDPAATICTVSNHGWNNGTFIHDDQFELSETNGEHQRITILDPNVANGHRYQTAGTLEDWKISVAKLCFGNSRLVFALSAAFAAALLEPMRQPNIGLHLRGISSIGKTTALYAAGSVWGGAKEGNQGFIDSWRSTANGLELACALHNDALLCLDEISLVNERDIGDVVYCLGNGVGKRRATRDIRARPVIQFRLVFLSCGERSLQEIMASAGKRSKGGQESRLIDIPADPGWGHGIFEVLHGHPTGAQLAQCLTQAAKTYYGTAARALVQYVNSHLEECRRELKKLQDQFIAKADLPTWAAGEVYRVTNSIGFIGAVGELASDLDITGWNEDHGFWAARECFKAWRIERGGTYQASDVQAGLSALSAFIFRYPNRFQLVSQATDDEIVTSDGNINPNDRAGFWQNDKNDPSQRLYLISRDVFKTEICRDYDYKLILATLRQHDLLVTNENDRDSYRVRIRGQGNARFYAVKSTVSEHF